jgi:hypothetical protein
VGISIVKILTPAQHLDIHPFLLERLQINDIRLACTKQRHTVPCKLEAGSRQEARLWEQIA